MYHSTPVNFYNYATYIYLHICLLPIIIATVTQTHYYYFTSSCVQTETCILVNVYIVILTKCYFIEIFQLNLSVIKVMDFLVCKLSSVVLNCLILFAVFPYTVIIITIKCPWMQCIILLFCVLCFFIAYAVLK